MELRRSKAAAIRWTHQQHVDRDLLRAVREVVDVGAAEASGTADEFEQQKERDSRLIANAPTDALARVAQ